MGSTGRFQKKLEDGNNLPRKPTKYLWLGDSARIHKQQIKKSKLEQSENLPYNEFNLLSANIALIKKDLDGKNNPEESGCNGSVCDYCGECDGERKR